MLLSKWHCGGGMQDEDTTPVQDEAVNRFCFYTLSASDMEASLLVFPTAEEQHPAR